MTNTAQLPLIRLEARQPVQQGSIPGTDNSTQTAVAQ
jgi:hypothetical protein